MPTLGSLLLSAKEKAANRLELLVLLSILAGLITAVVYRPATDVMNEVFASLNNQASDSEEYTETIELLTNGFPAIIFGQLGLIALSAFLLPYWARAAAPGDLIPGSGGLQAAIARGLIALKYLLVATGLTIMSLAILGPIILVVSQVLGSLGSLVALIGGIFLLWLNFAWSAVAAMAIAHSTYNTPLSYREIWNSAQVFIRPITGAYASLWLMSGILNLLLTNMAVQSLPEGIAGTLSLIITGSLAYAANALHLGAMFAVTDIVSSQKN